MNQSSENPENTNSQRENSFNDDNSIVRSRIVRRSDLTIASSSRFSEESDESPAVETRNRSKCTQSSSRSSPKPTIDEYFKMPTTSTDNRSVSVPEYDISQKFENFMFNSTSRQHINPRFSATTSAR